MGFGAAAAGGKTLKSEVFTASGTWTQPGTDVTNIEIVLVGGGGGGENKTAATNAGGGGGGEVRSQKAVVSGDVTVTIGAAGTGAADATDTDGTAGGNSTLTGNIQNDITALGGAGSTTRLGGGAQDAQAGRCALFSTGGGTGAGNGTTDGGSSVSLGGVGGGTNAGGGGGSLGVGGAGVDTAATPGVNGVLGGGGGGSASDGGGGGGGGGYCEIYWEE